MRILLFLKNDFVNYYFEPNEAILIWHGVGRFNL